MYIIPVIKQISMVWIKSIKPMASGWVSWENKKVKINKNIFRIKCIINLFTENSLY